jgi:hypothetical protein
MKIVYAGHLPVENPSSSSLNPFVVNLDPFDVGNFGPNLWVFHAAPFFQQRTSIDLKF